MEFCTAGHENLKSFKSTVKRTTFEKLDFSRFLRGQKNEKKYCFPKLKSTRKWSMEFRAPRHKNGKASKVL